MRLAIATLAGSLVVAAACSGSPSVQTRTVTVHVPRACAPGASPYALFHPFGDFPLQDAPPSLPLSDVGSVLAGFPAGTREIVATVTDANDAQWAAHAVLSGSGAIDLLALPFGSPCALTDAIAARSNAVLGAIDDAHVLVVGGAGSGGVPKTALADLARGTVTTLPVGLLVPRTGATVTAWSGGAVVAGGVRSDQAGGAPQASFEVFGAAAGDFGGATYPLSQPRSRHGAAVLASGETLLVGGLDASGNVLASMEAVDAATQRARTGGLGALAVPRADPVVMRLASGEILVAGGVDGSGAPVSTLEWFPADGSPSSRGTRELVASSHRAFLPLAAGGALAVIAPDAAATGFQSVWVITADGGLEAATPSEGLTDVRLFAGTEQAPVLWTGDRWLVWQPWVGAFTSFPPAIGAPGPGADPIASPEPGLGVWFDGAIVHALRFGTRGPYATTATSSPLLLADTSFTAPDRLVLAQVAGALVFDPATGLTLQPGASAFVTDATFASFSLDAATPGKLPIVIVLRDEAGAETVVGGASCGLARGGAIHVERDGDSLRASVDGGALVTCAPPATGARVSIGVRGAGTTTSVVRALAIARK